MSSGGREKHRLHRERAGRTAELAARGDVEDDDVRPVTGDQLTGRRVEDEVAGVILIPAPPRCEGAPFEAREDPVARVVADGNAPDGVDDGWVGDEAARSGVDLDSVDSRRRQVDAHEVQGGRRGAFASECAVEAVGAFAVVEEPRLVVDQGAVSAVALAGEGPVRRVKALVQSKPPAIRGDAPEATHADDVDDVPPGREAGHTGLG